MLRGVRGAADVFPDQIIGKGYVEIKIDRKKAARYGINVGDIQDVVEVAMGGRPLTMTVEGRERYPVRVRYARDYRDDVEALKGILVSARGMAADAGQGGGMGGDGCLDAVSRRARHGAADADPAGRGRRHPGGRGAVDDQERERPAPLLHPAPRPRPRRGRLRRGGAAGRRREGAEDAPARDVPRMDGHVRAPGPCPEDAADRLPRRDRPDRADPLPDAQELDRRAADDDQRARRPGRRCDLPVAVRLQLQRGRAGRLHRLLRHGGGDGRGDAGLPPRGDRRARRAGADRLDRRAAAGDPRRGDPPPAAQAPDRGGGHHLDRADALGHRASGPR